MPRLKKAVFAVVLTLSAIYAAWLAIAFTDYLALSAGKDPIFAQHSDGGVYSGLLYDVSSGEMQIFGNSVDPVANNSEL